MGHKVNPNIFRAYLSKIYLSNWYVEKLQYSRFLQQDFFLRNIIEKFLKKYTIVASIQINRINNKFFFKNNIYVIISCLFFDKQKLFNDIFFNSRIGANYYTYMNFFSRRKKKTIEIEEILKNLFILKFFKIMFVNIIKIFQKKFFNKVKFNLNFIEDFFEDINLIALHICAQIKKKINSKRIITSVLENLPENILGIKIQICGRHTGQQRATLDKMTYGIIQLNTLTCAIDYVQKENKTRDGAFGVKLWVYKKLKK